MKKVLLGFSTLILLAVCYAFSFPTTKSPVKEEVIKWYTWEEAVELNKKSPRKVFIDVYTDWCGWCKVMDRQTFTDPSVIKYMNEKFYAVKFNAEQREDVPFDNHVFKFIAQGNRGVHELAYSLLDGQMGYPAFVYLNEKFERITVSSGFKPAPDMLKELKFIGEEYFKTKSWEEYSKNQSK